MFLDANRPWRKVKVTARRTAIDFAVCMRLDANRPWRKVKVTARRTAIDFAVCMRELADLHYPKAERIRVVLDNLSTHSAGAFYQAFPAEQARRLLRRIELHYVPKHASWLNMVEIEIGVLAGQCLDRRIESYPRLTAEVAAWEKQRNGAQARIDWSFTTEKARTKMGRAYPRPTNLKRPQRSQKPLCQGTSEAGAAPRPLQLSHSSCSPSAGPCPTGTALARSEL